MLEEGLKLLESGAMGNFLECGWNLGEKAMEGQSVLSDSPKAWSGFSQIWMVLDTFPKPHLCLYSLSHCPVERESEELHPQNQIALIRPDGDCFIGTLFTLTPLGIPPRLL